jgi:hypothetical protein
MSITQIPYDAPVALQLEVPFEALTQERLLKPTQVGRFTDLPGSQWWQRSLRKSHSDYFLAHYLGAVVTYLKISVEPVRLMPQQPVEVRFQTRLGAYAVAGKPSRHGGIDTLEICDRTGARALRMETYWLWFSMPPGGRPGTLQNPPPEFDNVERQFEAHKAYPEVTGDPQRPFTWTRRETDLNQHVNSLAYYERAENALTDAGEPIGSTGDFEAWYVKPAFMGQRARAFLVRGDQHIVRLAAEDGPTSTVLSFPGRT